MAGAGLRQTGPYVPPESAATAPPAPQLSVLIPVLNDVEALRRLLEWLAPQIGQGVEILVIDGGSTDGSRGVAAALGVQAVLQGVRGRGAQLAYGVEQARGRWLWMLHADSTPEPGCLEYLLTLEDQPGWGRFSVVLEGAPLVGLGLVSRLMNARSCLTGICTGDQGIFVHRELLRVAGGMPVQSLMEDIELSRRLKRHCRPQCRTERIGTSARRWRQRGVIRTILSMWRFRLRYWLGADPERLAREYYR